MRVLDACVFINLVEPLEGVTVPCVGDELKDIKSKALFENMVREGKVKIMLPDKEWVEAVKRKAKEIGSEKKLSECDIQLLALALQLKGELVTDDYTMQNLAAHLGLKFHGCIRGEIKEKRVFRR